MIIVGRPARLNCNYIKSNKESVHSIKWFAAYSGVRSKIFELNVATGAVQASPLSFITVDGATATDDEVAVTLTEFRDSPMTFGCEVMVTKGNNYGSGTYTRRFTKKLGESPIRKG